MSVGVREVLTPTVEHMTDAIERRFFSASDARVADALAAGDTSTLDERTLLSYAVNKAVKQLARVIDESVPEGRQQSIALTELETVQMRANRGIFDPAVFKPVGA